VLRLKGGDPNVFGRGAEEALALAGAGIPFRVVPGVTAGLAALAAAAIPATMRSINQALIFATGQGAAEEDGLDWAALAATGQPLVIYMAMHNLEKIVAALLRGGIKPHAPAAIIASATTAQERVVISRLDRLVADAQAEGLEPPAIVAVGDIVAVRERILGAKRGKP
jgi:uroporphyrin-III C-methyltransferase